MRQESDEREPGLPGSAGSDDPCGWAVAVPRRCSATPREPLAAAPLAPASAARPLEVELAERLDSVLGIAERLAASHDRQDLFRTIVDETHARAARRQHDHPDPARRPPRRRGLGGHHRRGGREPAGLRPRRGLGRRGAADRPRPRLPGRPQRSQARLRPLRRRARVRRRARRAAHPPRPRHRLAGGGHLRAARLDERRRRVHHDPRDARRHRAHQRRALRADRGPRRPARRAPGGLGAAEPGRRRSRRSAGPSSRRPAGSSITTTPGCTCSRADDVVPIAFEGVVGRVRAGRLRAAALPARRGLHRLGRAPRRSRCSINDANLDAARRRRSPGTDDVDESMLVVPMRYDEATVGVITLSKLGLDQFDDDDLRLLTILADQAATAIESARLLARTQDLAGELRRLLDMSAELSESLDPRQVAEPDGRPPRPGHGRGRVRDQLLGSARRVGSNRSATIRPPGSRTMEPFYDVSGLSGDPARPRAPGDGHHRRRRPARRPRPRSS